MTEALPTPAALTQEIIDSLGKAAGACGQMIHSHGSPYFIFIRKNLENIKDDLTAKALREYEKPVFIRPL